MRLVPLIEFFTVYGCLPIYMVWLPAAVVSIKLLLLLAWGGLLAPTIKEPRYWESLRA